jgi:hypothetical protein
MNLKLASVALFAIISPGFSRADTAHDWIRCIKAEAAALDDGLSDAGTIAGAVDNACRQITVKEFRAKCGSNNYCFRAAMDGVSSTMFELSVRAVLDHRKGRN